MAEPDMTFLTESHDWTYPVPIAYGPGRLADMPTFCRDAGCKNPLIVTDRGSVGLPFLDALQRHLVGAGLSCGVYAGISPNPRDNEVAEGVTQYRQGAHDGIIALGGGSGMDGAKAICLTATNDIPLWDFEYSNTPPDMADCATFPTLFCIPTTAGTGAETESTGMVTDTARLMKFCVWHPNLKPSVVLLDPEITIGLPANLTAWTGCDALVHAIEAYCVPAFHPQCDGSALEALRLISQYLPTAVRDGSNLEARGGMQVGACLAGIAFLKGLGLVHSISHMVGAEFNTHHGLTNAVVLPAVLRFNKADIAGHVVPMAQAMGLADTSFEGFYNAVCHLLDDLEIPKTLADLGMPADAVHRIAKKAMVDAATETNPRIPTLDEMTELVKDALTLGR